MNCKIVGSRCVAHEKVLICPVARAKKANRAMHKKYSLAQMREWGRRSCAVSPRKTAKQ